MEATPSLKSLYQRCFGFGAKENNFLHFGPWTTREAGKMIKMPISGHIYPWETRADIICQNREPIVSVHKRTYYGSNPPLHPKSIVHAYGYMCKRQKWRACSQGNILYNSRQAWKDQTSYAPCSSWCLPIILSLFEAHIAVGFENEPCGHGNSGQILEEKSSFQTTMFRYALNCVEPSLTELKNRKWPRSDKLGPPFSPRRDGAKFW